MGYQQHRNPDTVPPIAADFDSSTTLGNRRGSPGTGFPRIGGIGDNVYGGMTPELWTRQPQPLHRQETFRAFPTLSWVHGNHTYKRRR